MMGLVLREMFMTNIKMAVAVGLTLIVLTSAVVVFAQQGAVPRVQQAARRAELASGPAGDPAPAGGRAPRPDQAMAKVKLQLAQTALHAFAILERRGEVALTDPRFALWESRKVEALRESGAGKEELIKALERYVSQMKRISLAAAVALQNGHQKPENARMDMLDADYRVLEGEAWLNQEKSR